MALNLSGLTKYVDQISFGLMNKMVAEGNTLEHITVLQNVKYKQALNLMSSSIVLKAQSCGLITPTDTTTLLQRDLEVCPLTVVDSICMTDFIQYWVNTGLPEGFNEIPQQDFIDKYLSLKLATIKKESEMVIWKGDKTNGTGNLATCDGLLVTLDNEPSVITSGATGSFTSTNAVSMVDTMYSEVPDDIKTHDGLTLYLSPSAYIALVTNMRNLNFYYGFEGQNNYSNVIYNYMNTNLKIVSTLGLTQTDKAVLTTKDNLYYGTGGDISMKFFTNDMYDNNVYFKANWSQGVQIAFPEFVVYKKS